MKYIKTPNNFIEKTKAKIKYGYELSEEANKGFDSIKSKLTKICLDAKFIVRDFSELHYVVSKEKFVSKLLLEMRIVKVSDLAKFLTDITINGKMDGYYLEDVKMENHSIHDSVFTSFTLMYKKD